MKKISGATLLSCASLSVILFLRCHSSEPSGVVIDGNDDKHEKIKLDKVCALPSDIPEASGLVMLDKDHFVTHNDSRGEPVLFVVDRKGNITRRITFMNERNKDWEEVTADRDGNYYVGDFGNNEGKRREFYIYKFPDPSTLKEDTLSAADIRFTIPGNTVIPCPPSDMNFDFEAMIHYGNSLYLFSKNRTVPYNGYCKLYKLPDTPGEYVATLIDSIQIGKNEIKKSSITGAAINSEETMIVLVAHERMWTITDFSGDDILKGKFTKYEFKNEDLSLEGVCFGDDKDIYFTEEASLPAAGMVFRCKLSDLQ